jgi:hypothetical protein
MPFDFVGTLILKMIENSSIVSRDHLIELVKKYPNYIYPRISNFLKCDKEILDIIFLNNKDRLSYLKFAPNELRTDEPFLLELVQNDVNTLGFIDDSMLNNINFVKKLIFINPESIYFVYDQFQIIYKAAKLEFDKIEADYLSALKSQDYLFLGKNRPLIDIIKLHKNDSLRTKSIEKINLDESQNFTEIKYPNNFQFDRSEFLKKSSQDFQNYLEGDYRVFESLLFLPELFKNDKEVAIKLIDESMGFSLIEDSIDIILANLSENLKNDDEVAIAILEKYPKLINALPESIKNNKNIARLVLKVDGMMLKYFSNEIRNDHEIVEIAVQSNPNSYLYASNEIRLDHGVKSNKLLLCNALKGNPDLIMHIDGAWLKDENVVEIIKHERPILLGFLQTN